MDMLTKGAFTVIAATVITSVLILFAGNRAVKSDIESNATSFSSQHVGLLPPPPGPFFKAQLEDGQIPSRDINSKLKPKAPIIISREKENLEKTLTLTRKKPSISTLEGAPAGSFMPPEELKEPVFNRGIKQQPSNPIMPAIYSKLSNERKPEPPVMPYFSGMQATPLSANITKFQNQYKYLPMPMMPNYQYQQYPTFGVNPYWFPTFDTSQYGTNTVTNNSFGSSMDGNNK
jgi:hypothetical protein